MFFPVVSTAILSYVKSFEIKWKIKITDFPTVWYHPYSLLGICATTHIVMSPERSMASVVPRGIVDLSQEGHLLLEM